FRRVLFRSPEWYGTLSNGYRWGLELEVGDFFFHDLGHGSFDILNADLLDDFVQETTHDQLASKRLWDPPSHEIEQLLFIKASNGRSVSSRINDSGFDFEVRNRVSLSTFGKQQVFVLLK